MHITNILLTVFEQVYDFPFMLSHEIIEQIDAGPESTVEHNLHHWRRLEKADAKRWMSTRTREVIYKTKTHIWLSAFHSHLSTDERGLYVVDFATSLSAT